MTLPTSSPHHRICGGVSVVILLFLCLAFPCRLRAQVLEPRVPGDAVYLEAFDGEPLTDGILGRQDTIAVFWASWSPRSRDVVARVAQVQRRWGDRVRIIAVNFQEDARAIQRFLRGSEGAWPGDMPIYLDTEGIFSRRCGVSTLPALVLFRNGAPVYQGYLGDDAFQIIARFFPGE